MSRPTTFTAVRLRLVTTSPTTISASHDVPGVNRPVAVTPDGAPWVPASGIAGALREHLASRGLDIIALMGGEDTSPDGDGLVPSRLRVMHTHLENAPVERRQQTRVDAVTGAAAAGSLRTSEFIPAGAVIEIDLLVDGIVEPDGEEGRAIRSFAPHVGSGVTNGHGATNLVEVLWGTMDLQSADGLTRWMSAGGRDLIASIARDTVDPIAQATIPEFDVTCTIVDPVAIEPRRDPAQMNRVVSAETIAATSIKGVIRHRAEFILRSLAADEGLDLAVANAAGDQLFGSTSRRGRLVFTESEIDVDEREVRHHVAIDRFTGGGIDGRLFEEDVVSAGTLNLRISGLTPLEAWERDLISAVLADISDGYVGIGARTGRGFGTITIEPVPEIPDLESVVSAMSEITVDRGA